MTGPGGADPTNLGTPNPAGRPSSEDRSGDHFAAPLGSSRSGRLRFTSGAHRIAIRAELRLVGLYRARFENRMPTVVVRAGVVTIRYPRVPSCDWLDDRSERLGEVELNARIPWDVEVRGGASRLLADLRGLSLGSLSIEGGAGRVEVVLPAPSGSVAVLILGGASNVAIHLPTGVATRLRLDGGATGLTFDERHIGAAGGELDLHSTDYDGVTDRYGITVTGGANNFSVDREQGRMEGAYLDLEGE